MKKILIVAVTFAAILPAARAAPESDPLATQPGWELGLVGAYYKYVEPGVEKLSGYRGGLVAARTFTNAAGVFSRIDFRESYGQMKYESPSGTQDRVPDWILEARAIAGRDFVGDGVSLSPYLGLGYRYLYNDFRGYLSTTNAVAYRRYSNILYAPVGLAARVRLGDRWVLVPTIEADVFLQGRQVTKLSDLDLGFADVTNQQSKGHGYRASLMLERGHWSVGAWTQYWYIKGSDSQCATALANGTCGFSYVEPENSTRETGLELRYRF